jgi:tripartite-type tricarboxylate transporter receptor subunit TctC
MLRLCLFAISLFIAAPAAIAQAWPTKPIKLVVPFPPGGSADPIARILANKLSASLGQQIIVDNRPGASGAIGTSQVAKSAPDGYTFILVFDTHSVNPALNPNMAFDTVKDLAPVTLVGTAPMAIATLSTKPYKTFADVVAAAKAKPGAITVGSALNGSLGHLSMIQIEEAAGVKLVQVPYRGAASMVNDALGGHVELAIGSVSSMAQHVRSGKLHAVAVTGEKRSNIMPDVPTLAEQGLPGFNANAWWAIFAPVAIPKPILDKFHSEVVKTLNEPEVKKQLSEQLGMQISGNEPHELQAFLLKEMQRWGKIIKDNNIRAD